MISFDMLSAAARAIFALWALLLCLTDVADVIISAVKKRYRLAVLSVLLFAPVYFMWQMIFDYSLFGKTQRAVQISLTMCGLPWVYWFIVFLIISIAALLILLHNIKNDKTFVNSGTIKTFLDKMPCGVCCWRENGRVLFSNICMNELCIATTNMHLLNGNDFRDAVRDGIINVDGKVWRFTCSEIVVEGENLFEMIASDITAEYAKTKTLENDKEELSRLNKELWEYYLSIDASVQHQEILQAKINIHDEMNRLMLSTVAADKNDVDVLDNIFSLWEKNALLLCMEADKKTGKQQRDTVEKLANGLGIELIWQEALPSALTEKQKELFFFTAQEAVINAVKHAGAKTMEISFEETDENVLCFFKNDGNIPSHEVEFEGGLANIAMLAEKQGACVYIEVDEYFTLVLKF